MKSITTYCMQTNRSNRPLRFQRFNDSDAISAAKDRAMCLGQRLLKLYVDEGMGNVRRIYEAI